ncbi:ribulose-phosphate 3-epimerase [Bacillus tuaregi]|uniref:ribulose-phosphate 3-epimerase n=1 Tax=Bacillus tuaregi TaxID=1816695 RepID=UPI0008F82C5F|nr:ribulose-phosphate 3-epimerase [Bacillus tuaregi]
MHSIAASIMCGDQLNLGQELRKLEEAAVDLLHCDVMDGSFVNNLAMGPYVLEQIKERTSIPLDIHLATEQPSKYIDMFAPLQPKYISFHVEVCEQIEKDIEKIKGYGIEPVLAVNPESPIEMIKPYLSMVPMLLIMTVNPGFAGQRFNHHVLEKLVVLSKLIETMENKPLIEVDGNINVTTVPALIDRGANVFVLGTSALFNHQKGTYEQKVNEIRELFEKRRI